MVLLVMAVSLTPLFLISGIILYQFHVSYHEKVLAHLKEVVLKHGQNIDSFLEEKLADIRVLASSYSVEQLSEESFLQERLAVLQQQHGGTFVDLGLVNEDGLQVAYAGSFKLGRANYAEADWYKKSIKTQYFISDVFLGLRGLPHFIVAIKKEWQDRTWILRSTIDFVAFNSLVENLRIGKTGLAFIINRKGEFQTRCPTSVNLDIGRYVELLNNDRTPSLGETEPYLNTTDLALKKRVTESRVTVVEEKPSMGADSLNVSTLLKNGEWVLVYRQDKADAFADLYRTRKAAFIILMLGGLGIVSMAFVISKRMISHIASADQEKDLMTQQVIEAGKMASVGELAAGVAHEINNPVAIMVEEAGWIEDLLEEDGSCEDPDEVRRALSQIKNQGTRCKQITRKLLSFAHKTDPELRKVQLNELIEEVIGLSEQRAKYSNVKIQMNLEPLLPEVYASPSEFEQVLLNLINNALDAMSPDGGSLDIITRIDGERAIVDIADTGQGIPKANLSRIFDPFFTTKPVGKGTGLGLCICYGIVKKIGGDIGVDSTVGVGTTFHIKIPLPPEDLATRKQLHKRLAPHLGDIHLA